MALGLDRDIETLQRKDLDGFQQMLVQVLSNYLGNDVAAAVTIHLIPAGPEKPSLVLVKCSPHPHPVFLQDGQAKECHVRVGNVRVASKR